MIDPRVAETEPDPGPGRVEYEPGQEPVSSDTKFEVLATEADGFYKTVVTVSTAIMGGTLIFLEKVAPHPTLGSIIVLGTGWMFLFAAIGSILYVRRKNLESLRLALRGEYPAAGDIDARTRRASSMAPYLMIIGMALAGLSGLMNLWKGADGGNVSDPKSSEAGRVPLSIAGGDTGPKGSQPSPPSVPAPKDPSHQPVGTGSPPDTTSKHRK